MGLNEVALGIPVPDYWAQNMVRVIGEQSHRSCIPRCLCSPVVAHDWVHTCAAALPVLSDELVSSYGYEYIVHVFLPVQAPCISRHPAAPKTVALYSRGGQGRAPAAVCQAGQPAGGAAAGSGGPRGAHTAAAVSGGGRHEAGLLAGCTCCNMPADQQSPPPSMSELHGVLHTPPSVEGQPGGASV